MSSEVQLPVYSRTHCPHVLFSVLVSTFPSLLLHHVCSVSFFYPFLLHLLSTYAFLLILLCLPFCLILVFCVSLLSPVLSPFVFLCSLWISCVAFLFICRCVWCSLFSPLISLFVFLFTLLLLLFSLLLLFPAIWSIDTQCGDECLAAMVASIRLDGRSHGGEWDESE